MTDLATTDKRRLAELETIIDSGLDTFVDVGLALIEIRENKLYREHGTWDAYCKNRWGWGKTQANQLIRATRVSIANESARAPFRSAKLAARLSGFTPHEQRALAELVAPMSERRGLAILRRYEQNPVALEQIHLLIDEVVYEDLYHKLLSTTQEMGNLRLAGAPAVFARTDADERDRARVYLEHTIEVCRELIEELDLVAQTVEGNGRVAVG